MTTSTDTKPADREFPFEQFAELSTFPWLRHVFVTRQPDVPLTEDREACLRGLRERHGRILALHGIPIRRMASAQQVHGGEVAWIDEKPGLPVAGVDGLATSSPGLPIGVYVADCCPVHLVDPDHKAIAVLHSGLKGTRSNIARAGVRALVKHAGSRPSSLLAVLGPCIRDCCYREEFADDIARQLASEGVANVVRHDVCTACKPSVYYSYHREKGRTGRMLAAMMVLPESADKTL